MIDFHVKPDLLYAIPAENHSAQDIRNVLSAHPEIRFVSLAAVDLMGNDTDEKIPISACGNEKTRVCIHSVTVCHA